MAGFGRRMLASAPARWITGRWGRQLRWARDRFDPRLRRGLSLTTAVVALLAVGWGAGALLHDVLAVQTVVPRTAGAAFPSVATAAAAALAVRMTVLAGTRWQLAHRGHWLIGVRTAATASMLVAVVAVAALVNASTTFSGVLGGAAMGALWALALEVQRMAAPMGAGHAPTRA